jgi:hypothetical protein
MSKSPNYHSEHLLNYFSVSHANARHHCVNEYSHFIKCTEITSVEGLRVKCELKFCTAKS